MNIHRALAREYRLQLNMKKHLAKAQARTGFTLPERVAVTLETLLDVKRQLEEHFAKNAPINGTHLN